MVEPYVSRHMRAAHSISGVPSFYSPSLSKEVLPIDQDSEGRQSAQISTSTAPAAAAAAAPASAPTDSLSALLARNLFFELCLRRAPISEQRGTIARLLHSLPLLHDLPEASVHQLAQAAELRYGERYAKLYNYGVEPSGECYAFVLLSGAAESCEESLRAKSEPPLSRVDAYAPGELCGAELLAAPPRRNGCRDPAVPRTQTCVWTSAGAALALPYSALQAAAISPDAMRPLEQQLCAQLLATMLPDRDTRTPSAAHSSSSPPVPPSCAVRPARCSFSQDRSPTPSSSWCEAL